MITQIFTWHVKKGAKVRLLYVKAIKKNDNE